MIGLSDRQDKVTIGYYVLTCANLSGVTLRFLVFCLFVFPEIGFLCSFGACPGISS